MKRLLKRVISIVVATALTAGILPFTALNAMAASDGTVTISNEYISVTVSGKNGGFLVKTRDGDKLIKSDDNKELLYHRDEYDTSFTSFEVTYADGSTKEYLFGGSYGFLGMSSSEVNVIKVNDSEIHATWRLNDLVFTQKISLVSSGANEHGMVSIAYDVENNSSSAVGIRARILLDTAFGDQDYGTYQVIDAYNQYRSIWKETVLTASDSIPQNFYANDDPYSPGITAYTVSKQGQLPYQVAFGHWNNLAATVFSFAPDPEMDFTDRYNEYKTADSAYALYYDLGSLSGYGGKNTLITYYGVYAHHDVSAESEMTLDVTAPTALSLDSGKKAYERLVDKGIADFSVQMVLKNLLSDDSSKNVNYDTLTLAIYSSAGIMPLDANGQAIDGFGYEDTEPYIKAYADVKAGDTVSDTLYFAAKPNIDAEYRRIKIQVFNTAGGASDLTQDKLFAEKVFYVLCPGTDGDLPKITFSSLKPDTIYYSGTRHLYVTGTNIDFLYTSIINGNCTLKAYGNGAELTIPKENVLQPGPDKLDIIITDNMATGDWHLQLEWSDQAVKDGLIEAQYQKQTAPALKFTVSNDKQYKNDTYGVIAVVQLADTEKPTYRIMSFRDENEFQAFKEGEAKSDGTKKKEYTEILLEMRGEFEIVEQMLDESLYRIMPLKVKATSTKSSVDSKATNCITINNCIDFEDGVMHVYYTGSNRYGDIMVTFDGSLYTTGSRTSIWKGEAGLTKIEQGKEFSLIPYDTDGNRDDKFRDEPISLVWPSVFGTAQTIAGMVFNLAYGRLGIMYDDDGNEVGRLISFGAKLDLGFLIPKGKKDESEKEDTYWTRMQQFWRYYKYGERGEYADWLYCNYDKFPIPFGVEKKGDDPYKDDDDKEKAASVMVEDILYGCGKGFVGVHFKTEIAIPNYVAGMPKLKGELEVNTIGNWMFGFEGEMKMTSITLELALTIKSYKNIPIPDKIYFFIEGFEPGFNPDGHAVLWITGGGGGIDNLYDTIFLTGGVPPLKLLLSVSFDLLKVLSARCDLSLGPRGFSLCKGYQNKEYECCRTEKSCSGI